MARKDFSWSPSALESACFKRWQDLIPILLWNCWYSASTCWYSTSFFRYCWTRVWSSRFIPIAGDDSKLDSRSGKSGKRSPDAFANACQAEKGCSISFLTWSIFGFSGESAWEKDCSNWVRTFSADEVQLLAGLWSGKFLTAAVENGEIRRVNFNVIRVSHGDIDIYGKRCGWLIEIVYHTNNWS